MKCQKINVNTYPIVSFKAKSVQPITKPLEKPIKKEVKTLGSIVLSGLAALGILSKNNQTNNTKTYELSDTKFNKKRKILINDAKEHFLKQNIKIWLTKDNIEMFEWIVKRQEDEVYLAYYINNHGRVGLKAVEQVFYTPDIPHEHAAGILQYSDNKNNNVDAGIQKYRENRAKIIELKPLIENYPVEDSKKQNKQSVLEYLDHPPYTQNMEYITYEKLVNFIENNEHSILDYDILFSKDEETFDLRMDFAKILKYHNIDDDFINNNLNYINQNEYPRFMLFSHLKKYNSDFLKKLIQVDNHNLTNVIMIAAYLKESNIEFFKKLCNDDRFYDWLKNDENDLIEELSEIDESNVDIVDEMYECTKNINKDDFINLMREIIKTNRTTVELCKAYGINPIIGAGNTINCNNAPVIKKIYDTGNYSNNEVREFALFCVDKQANELFEALGTDERKFSAEQIIQIYNDFFYPNKSKKCNIPKHKFEALMKFVQSQKLSASELTSAAAFVHSKPLEYMLKLCSNDTIPNDKIFDILVCLENDNLPAAKALLESKNINSEDIATILKNTKKINKEEIPYDLLEEDVLSWNPHLVDYPMDSWNFVVENGFDQKMWDKMLEQNPVATYVLSSKIGIFSDYAKANNPHITNIHLDFINDAAKNKNLLKSWGNDLSDEELYAALFDSSIINTLGKLGKGVLESKFSETLDGLKDFCEDIAAMKLAPEQYEKLALKIYPENSQKYKKLEKEVAGYRDLISGLLTKDELDARKALSLKILKYELRLRNEGVNKKAIKQKIKELKSQKQAILYNSKNANDIKFLMKWISNDLSQMKKIASQKVDLSPQEIADKVQVIAQLPGGGACSYECFTIPSDVEIKNKKDALVYLSEVINDVIDLVQPNTKENEEKWNEYINRLIYCCTNTGYKKELSDKLELHKSKYISKIYTSSGDFFDNLNELLLQIDSHPDLSIEDAIDIMEQNKKTKQQYAELGVNYDKWTKVDKNSFFSVKTKLDINEAKTAAIKNLEEDLNDMVKMVIPDEQLISFHKRLNNSGYKMYKGEKVLYDENGFKTGTKSYGYLYKDDKPIKFEDLNKVINIIKEELNRNDFWSTTNNDEYIEMAREHLYHHFMKLRPAEIDNARNIKEGEVIDIEIRKTNLYDIKKALGLGNDAACCTALGSNFNEWTAPNYILNKCIGAIELNDRGNYAGNTMIYLAKVNGELSLILDNIEIKAKYQFNNAIRDAFFEYARKLCKEIGKPNMPIYAGPNRHKVDMKEFPIEEKTMEIVGDSGDFDVYLDFDADAHKIKEGIKHTLDLYRIS